jgi:hypothetical protein
MSPDAPGTQYSQDASSHRIGRKNSIKGTVSTHNGTPVSLTAPTIDIIIREVNDFRDLVFKIPKCLREGNMSSIEDLYNNLQSKLNLLELYTKLPRESGDPLKFTEKPKKDLSNGSNHVQGGIQMDKATHIRAIPSQLVVHSMSSNYGKSPLVVLKWPSGVQVYLWHTIFFGSVGASKWSPYFHVSFTLY